MTSIPDQLDRPFGLIEALLEAQQQLTAVEEFSARMEMATQNLPLATRHKPAQTSSYRSLLPASPPGPNQQYAFEVDLDTCSGCKACVVACHTLNGLEDNESWRRVGAITIGGSVPETKHVTTACHHCVDPGCLAGCPVAAYVKDPLTGIVRHLDDQCIGCKYCTMMCPYEVPSYSQRLGIVRKCDMCHQRLAVGEPPACVQACPNGAISIRVVESDEPVGERLVAGAPHSSLTRPTTQYRAHHPPGVGIAQDESEDEPADAHWPLAVMLVAVQTSVGIMAFERMLSNISSMSLHPSSRIDGFALAAVVVGLAIVPLHLGQPFRAWRIFLGLKTSWLSREAVLLGMYAGLLSLIILLSTGWARLLLPRVEIAFQPGLMELLRWATLAVGSLGVISSAMIYIATGRELWKFSRTSIRFCGSLVVCGAAWISVISSLELPIGEHLRLLALVTVAALAAKLSWEWSTHLKSGFVKHEDNLVRRSRSLVNGRLATFKWLRLLTGLSGGGLLLVASTGQLGPIGTACCAVGGACLLTCGEVAERLLYFSSVVYPRMPGTLR